ncbi:hypothetical protein AWZ03_001680 [Drosophila navojoa]|uniref:Uncharacterized protein n=1 Tax=Drosophila navojoa TaxID=7232 RepID=A0A484BVA0_DRONA|nr:hypothetical protein AWZ03_001680 [Drosophila navojoa]
MGLGLGLRMEMEMGPHLALALSVAVPSFYQGVQQAGGRQWADEDIATVVCTATAHTNHPITPPSTAKYPKPELSADPRSTGRTHRMRAADAADERHPESREEEADV